MTLKNIYRAFVPMLTFVLMACGSPTPAAPAAVSATTAPTTVPTPVPPTAEPPTSEPPTAEAPTAEPPTPEASTPETASEPPAAPATELSFTPATYTDENGGFALDYPSDWTLDPSSQIGERGGQALLLSPGTTPETLADGGTRVSITTYLWDPKNDLDAYVAQRKVAWDASGFAITREEQLQLADGRTAYVFVVNTPDQPTVMLLTTAGEDYLQIAGDGDAGLVEEIARTLRPLS